jgi:hypothetical protein
MEHLTVEDRLGTAEEAFGAPAVRDIGLLDAAAHRPQASALGQDADPTIHEKAAALLEAVVRQRALVDGNKRLGWAATASSTTSMASTWTHPRSTRRSSWWSRRPPVTWSWRSSPGAWLAGHRLPHWSPVRRAPA